MATELRKVFAVFVVRGVFLVGGGYSLHKTIPETDPFETYEAAVAWISTEGQAETEYTIVELFKKVPL